MGWRMARRLRLSCPRRCALLLPVAVCAWLCTFGCEALLVGKDACVDDDDCYAPYACEAQRCVVRIDVHVADAGVGRVDGGPPVPNADGGVLDGGVLDGGGVDGGAVDGVHDGGILDAGVLDAGLLDAGPQDVVDAGRVDAGVDGGCADATCPDWRLYELCEDESTCGSQLQCVPFDLYLLASMCVPSCTPTSSSDARGGCPADETRGVWCLTSSSIGGSGVDNVCVAHPDAADALLLQPNTTVAGAFALTADTQVQPFAVATQLSTTPVTVTVTPSNNLDVVLKSTTGSGVVLQSCDSGIEGEAEVCGLVLGGPARHHFRVEPYDGQVGTFTLAISSP